MANALAMFFVLMLGALLGMILVSVLSANSRNDDLEDAYILGYRDCMQNRPPRVQIR